MLVQHGYAQCVNPSISTWIFSPEASHTHINCGIIRRVRTIQGTRHTRRTKLARCPDGSDLAGQKQILPVCLPSTDIIIIIIIIASYPINLTELPTCHHPPFANFSKNHKNRSTLPSEACHIAILPFVRCPDWRRRPEAEGSDHRHYLSSITACVLVHDARGVYFLGGPANQGVWDELV